MNTADRRTPSPFRQVDKSPDRAAWLAALVGALCYANSLTNGFALDDIPIVRDNPRILSAGNFRPIWLSDWWGHIEQDPQGRRDRLYRPLTLHTFALNAAVGGPRPLSLHLVNALLHAAACWLVWQLARRLFSDGVSATCAAFLFAVHPIHAEAVANVVGRAELLATVFMLAGLIVLMPREAPPGWRRVATAGVLFLAALLSKETAVCYPAIAAIVLLHRRSVWVALRTSLRNAAVTVAILSLPLLIYFPLRAAALEGHLLRDRPPSVLTNPLVEAAPGARLIGPFEILGRYTQLMFAPLRLSSNYGLGVLDASSRLGPQVWLGAAAAIGPLVALYGYRRPRRSAWRRAAVAAAMFIASYALISNTLLLIGVSMAERLFYWPSVPACLLIAAVGVAAFRRASPAAAARRLLLTAGAVALLLLAARTVARNADWADNRALFAADVAAYPAGVVHNLNLARTLLADGDPALARAALPHLHRALDSYPNNPAALFQLGRAYGLSGDLPRAVEYLDAAIRFDPHNAEARRMLAALRTDPGAVARQLESLRAATAADPSNARLWTDLGLALRAAGREDQATEAFQRAADLVPDDPETLFHLAGSLALGGDPQRAMELFLRVVRLDPSNWAAHANLSKLLASTDPAASLDHARQAHRLKPDAFETRVNLAAALAMNGLTREAIAHYEQIEPTLAPDDPRRGFISDRIKRLRDSLP